MISRNSMQPICLWRQGNRAFTLMEVLVVAAIMALLVAVLMPSLRRARRQARSIACQSTTRELARGMIMYIQSHAAFPAHQWILPDGRRLRWFNAMAKEIKGSGAAVRPSDGQYEEQFEAYRCPSMSDWNVGRNNAYGYNYKYLGSGRDNSIAPTAPHERYPVKGIRAPARTIAFGDTDGTGWTLPHRNDGEEDFKNANRLGNHGYVLDPTYIPSFSMETYSDGVLEPYAWKNYRTVISDRHLGGSNFAFADGHAELLKPEQVYVDNRYWNGLGGEDPKRDVHVDFKRLDGEVRWAGLGV